MCAEVTVSELTAWSLCINIDMPLEMKSATLNTKFHSWISAAEFTCCTVYTCDNADVTYVCCNETFYFHLQDRNLTLYHNNPDLTECFQLSVLPWIPCIYLWLVFPFYFIYLKLNNRGYVMMSILNRIKTVRVAAVCRNSGRYGNWDLQKSFIPPSSIITKHSLDYSTFNTKLHSHTNEAFWPSPSVLMCSVQIPRSHLHSL